MPQGLPSYRPQGVFGSGAAAITVAVLVLLIAGLVALPLAVTLRLIHPSRQLPAVTPAADGLAYTSVAFPSRTVHVGLSGWWIPAPGGTGATAVLVSGYRENRLIGNIGLPLAQVVQAQGWNVLMFDFSGTGRSQPGDVAPGPGEVSDVLGAVRYARSRVAQAAPIVVLGYGAGGDMALLAAEQDQNIAGVLADSPFSSLSPYLRRNLARWAGLPTWPFRALLLQAWPLVTGVPPASVDPQAGMAGLGARPVLLIAGTADAVSPARDARALASADPGSDLWVVQGAAHLQAWTMDHAGYVQRLDAWLAMCVNAPAA